MKTLRPLKIIFTYLIYASIYSISEGQGLAVNKSSAAITNYVQTFLDTLTNMHDRSSEEYFKIHCNSIRQAISTLTTTSPRDTGYIKSMYNEFINNTGLYKANNFSSYTGRRLPLIISWVSPTDGTVSLSWLKLPVDWDPEKEYPMYVDLHGDFFAASNPLRYMEYPFSNPGDYQSFFENGYLLQPWGRGNLWYEAIAETDIWESIYKLQSIVKIDHTRMYLTGFSMGGCGTWKIALKSPNYWAAIGVLSGALSMGGDVATKKNAEILKNVPVFFGIGTYDFFYDINYSACKLLIEAGNKNTKFSTFYGGHEYSESNIDNMYAWIRNFTNDDWTGIDNQFIFPGAENLISNYPNPVINTCTISYYVPINSKVSIRIVDLFGRIVANLENGSKNAGNYKINFDAGILNSGIYLISFKAGTYSAETRMTVVK